MPPHRPRTLAPHALAVLALSAAVSSAGPAAATASAPRSRAAAAADAPWVAAPVGQFGGSIQAMAADVERGIVWLSHGPRVVALDVRDPTAPTVVGRTGWMDREVTAVAVDGVAGVALTGFPSGGPEEEALHTLDLTDPAAPRVVARLVLDGAARAVALAGGIAYVVREPPEPTADDNPYRRMLVAVDVRDPAAPRLVDDDVVPAPADVIDVRVVGRALAVTATEPDLPVERGTWHAVLHVLDLADPSHPARAARVEDEAWCRLGEGPGAERAGWLYGYGHSGGIVALDVSVPAAPREVQRWAPDNVVGLGACDGFQHPLFLVDAAGLPYVASTEASVDVGGWLAAVGPAGVPGRRPRHGLTVGPSAAAIVGTHILVADAGGDIAIVATGSLAAGDGAPDVVRTLHLLGSTSAIAGRDDLDDGRLYAALGYGGLSVLSLERPLHPVVVGRVVDNLARTSLHVAGGWAAVGRINLVIGQRVMFVDETEVLDVSDPTAPRAHRAFDAGRFGRVLTTSSGAWLVHGRFGSGGPGTPPDLSPVGDPPGRVDAPLPLDMRLYDGVTNGERFVAVGASPPQAVAPDCGTKRIDVWNVSNPNAPRREGQLDLGPCRAGRPNLVVAAAGELAYVGEATYMSDPSGVPRSELTVVALDHLAGPRVVARLPISGTISGLAQRDGYVFANAGRAPDGRPAVVVVDARDPTRPRIVGTLAVAGMPAVVGERVYVNTGPTGVWVFEPPVTWWRPRGPMWLALPWVGARAVVGARAAADTRAEAAGRGQ